MRFLLLPVATATLTIIPLSGLANRMRALDGALEFSRFYGHRLRVIWFRNKVLNCNFRDLFEIPAQIHHLVELDRTTLVGKLAARVFNWYFRTTSDAFIWNRNLVEVLEQDPGLEKMGKNAMSIFVRTHSRFFECKNPFHNLSPVESVMKAVRQTMGEHRDFLGLHVRRTDHKPSTEISTIEAFASEMEREIASDPDAKFFLATDEPEVEKALNDRFPGRITSRQKRSLDRNNPEAIVDALIDLYCLAACKKVIGSYWSSFSETAWQIGGIDHVTAGYDEPSETAGNVKPNGRSSS